MHGIRYLLCCAVLTAGCTGTPSQNGTEQEKKSEAAAVSAAPVNPYPSTYKSAAAAATLIRGATVLTGTGARLDNADVLIANGHIEAVGPNLAAPAGARVIEASGRWVTPGLIDVHSHLGVYASPGVNASSDGNEATDPVTANVWAEHGVWPQDPGFQTALEGGITSLQILPGSANLIGGRGVTLKNVPATTYQAMKFPDAPQGLKMACGENPKRVYGGQARAPSTRMGNVAGYRQAFADAQDYREQWSKYEREAAEYAKKQTEKSKDKKDSDESNSPPVAAETRSQAGDAGRGDVRRGPRPHPLLSLRRDGDHARPVAGSSVSRLPRSITPSRRTRSRTCWRRTACAAPSGPTGGAARWRCSTASRRTSH